MSARRRHKNLLDWIAVEVPASVDADSVHGIGVDVPAGILGLLTNQVVAHDTTANAVLEKSRTLAVQAFQVGPVTTVSKGISDLFDHMIAEQSPWLDYLGD